MASQSSLQEPQAVTHTPGPWRAAVDDAAIIATRDMTLARVYWSEGRSEAENRANARLIAAAPELLAAAELAVQHFRRNQVSGNFQGDDEHEAWTALTRAIRKASDHAAL